MIDIDWTNPTNPVSHWFSVKECLYLPSWNRMANEGDGLNDEIKQNLINLCVQMDYVREFLNAPIIVHCVYRPPEYSSLVGGTSTDVHTMGMAIDWSVDGINCDKLREVLLPSLESLQMRMENNPGSDWVHTDIHPVINERYFNP